MSYNASIELEKEVSKKEYNETYDQNGGLRPVSPGDTNTTVIKKVVSVSQ